MKNEKEKKEGEETFSIITLGESGVGKTSILKRFVYDRFDEENISTIGINFAFKEIALKNNTKIKIRVIDTAGQEKYRSLSKSYFKNAEAVLYVFSLDKEGSLEKIKEWIKLFKENNNSLDIPAYLIRNKIDLEDEFDEESIKDLLNEKHIRDFMSASAKNDINISKIFEDIANLWYEKYRKLNKKQTKTSELNLKEIDRIKGKNRCHCIKGDL